MLQPLCYLAEKAPPQCRSGLLAHEEQPPPVTTAADESAGPCHAWGQAPEMLPGTFTDIEAKLLLETSACEDPGSLVGSLVSDDLWLEASWEYLAKALYVLSVLWRRDGYDVPMRAMRQSIEACMRQSERHGRTPRRVQDVVDALPLETIRKLQHTSLFACFECQAKDGPTWPHPTRRDAFEERWCAGCWSSWSRSWN